jgi:hypothetical protein
MTREEQYIEAANPYIDDPLRYLGFMDGAEWADSHPRWISVEDELPKKYDSYLTCTSGNVIEITHYNIDGWHTESRGEVTHWMPLPQAPKIGGKK